MLCRCYIAEESRSACCCDGSSDCRCDVIIARSDICYDRSEYVERCTHAEGLLHLHVSLNLIHRHVSRTLNHHLNILLPRALCKLTESYELLNLAYIAAVCKAARAAGVAERDSYIILTADVQNLIVVLIERILLPCHAHPCKNKRTSTRYYVHLPLVFSDLIDGLSRNAAMQRNEINSILCVKSDYVDEIFCTKSGEISLIVYDAVIYRHCSDHCRALACELSSERLCVAVR